MEKEISDWSWVLQRCSKIGPTYDFKKLDKCLKSQGNNWVIAGTYLWYCQSSRHIAIAGAFHCEAYFESKKYFCQIGTPNIDRWPKVGTRTNSIMFPNFNQRQLADVDTVEETWVHYFEPVSKIWNKIWLTKLCRRPVVAKTPLITKALYYIFFSRDRIAVQVAEPKCYSSVLPRCYTSNDALCQDLCMFVYFLIMPHHKHLSLWRNLWSQSRLPSCNTHHTLQI